MSVQVSCPVGEHEIDESVRSVSESVRSVSESLFSRDWAQESSCSK